MSPAVVRVGQPVSEVQADCMATVRNSVLVCRLDIYVVQLVMRAIGGQRAAPFPRTYNTPIVAVVE